MPNAKVLESKKAIVDALATKLQGSTAAVFVDYKGITVATSSVKPAWNTPLLRTL